MVVFIIVCCRRLLFTQAGRVPVVKLFTSGTTWLLTELDPDDPTIAFGLCASALTALRSGT
ncbi:DUF2958 domain-containing protein [Mesorhizobium tamadayense]|uniref:DUF2958 domain-containing protein n=1 Tax=Mesorhizobium tamadayense TaxID=425306 RepID=UPI003CCAD7C0